MNIAYELSKVRDAFAKVRTDMNFLSENIMKHYSEHNSNHKLLSDELARLSSQVSSFMSHHREHTTIVETHDKGVNKKQLHDIKDSIRDLKKEVTHVHQEHTQLISLVEDMNRNKVDKDEFKSFQDKFRASELELHLLKEKLNQKDNEISTLKEVNSKMFSIIDELTQAELDLVDATK